MNTENIENENFMLMFSDLNHKRLVYTGDIFYQSLCRECDEGYDEYSCLNCERYFSKNKLYSGIR